VVDSYDNPVLIKQFAESMCNLRPTNEQIIESNLRPAPPPGAIVGQPHPRPAEPNDALIRLAAKVSPDNQEVAATRRGLLLVSIGLLLFAVLFFGPAPRRRKEAHAPL
jgi:hypothetical protein